ncbi:hypothetical protein [Streptomyces sp. NPDC051738]|uniref:hypothetical protein n=1 Tax=Streptomyces sp. NPDC051738 TaxID=3365672 RepID=UPI0037D8CB75
MAIHLDVDTAGVREGSLGPGQIPDGLTGAQVNRIAHDLAQASDVVATTVAESFPRDVVHVQQVLRGFPLIGG